MKTYSEAVLFIGLIFNIILILFVATSVLLIYALLMISVETKTFDTGVMRMLGLSKNGFVIMILFQSIMFVLPSIICGFIFCVPMLFLMYQFMFTDELGFTPSLVPETSAIFLALSLGFIIPLLSSIVPIQSALSQNLNDSLNVNRNKSSGVLIQIFDSSKANIIPYVLFGTIAVIYGISIYYLLPLALLSANFSLILQIFFFILLGMIFGLTLLAFNL
mmetsp:Transcript_39219/g.28359  ORF Transcript_39219/g.28359 Transcript_39219/m.28359 type:complete len:219 (+) Transcript_39219:1305-1961(+)